MIQLQQHFEDFAEALGDGGVEIYNEFSLQHELGIFLRERLTDCKIQFERNVAHFNICKSRCRKREIDIAIIDRSSREPLGAVELKYPQNQQYPKRMYDCCRDISFLEQLVAGGFRSAYFFAVADDPLYYSLGQVDGIYGYFRSEVPISGRIDYPIRKKDRNGETNDFVSIMGKYVIKWREVSGSTKYCIVRIDGKMVPIDNCKT